MSIRQTGASLSGTYVRFEDGDLIAPDDSVISVGASATLSTVNAAGAAQTVDPDLFDVYDLTLTAASCALTLGTTTPGVPKWLTLLLRQDGVGGRGVAFPGSVYWADASAAPSLSTTAGAVDSVDLLTVDGGVSWIGFGGRAAAASSSGGGLLAYKAHTLVAAATTSSSTAADIDATNLAVTFTAPASGKVLLRASGLVQGAPNTTYAWAWRSGSTTVAEFAVVFGGTSLALSISRPVVVTGLTPGNNYTYKLAHRLSFGTTTCQTNTDPIVLEVLSA